MYIGFIIKSSFYIKTFRRLLQISPSSLGQREINGRATRVHLVLDERGSLLHSTVMHGNTDEGIHSSTSTEGYGKYSN